MESDKMERYKVYQFDIGCYGILHVESGFLCVEKTFDLVTADKKTRHIFLETYTNRRDAQKICDLRNWTR